MHPLLFEQRLKRIVLDGVEGLLEQDFKNISVVFCICMLYILYFYILSIFIYFIFVYIVEGHTA